MITPQEVLGAGDWAALTAALARGKRQRLAGCPWLETTALVVAAQLGVALEVAMWALVALVVVALVAAVEVGWEVAAPAAAATAANRVARVAGREVASAGRLVPRH